MAVTSLHLSSPHFFRKRFAWASDRCGPVSRRLRREDTPGAIRHAPGSNLLLGVYTHTVEEDDRLVAEQLGEMLCPNVAKLAQEKTFAESGGVVIQ